MISGAADGANFHEPNTKHRYNGSAIVTVVVAAIVLFIMLYTVRERTREIGTLKALGASSMAILGQFMLEGVLLSLIAGLVGLVIGTVGATSLANLLLPHPTQAGNSTVSATGVSLTGTTSASISVTITPELVLFGLGVAVLLGALGSLFPAWRAARTHQQRQCDMNELVRRASCPDEVHG